MHVEDGLAAVLAGVEHEPVAGLVLLFQAQDAEGALTEIRLRTALKYPQPLDITEEIMEELNVQDTNP